MTNAIEDYQGELPEGWTGGHAVAKWWRGKIVHLYTLRKPCAQCHAEMKIDVTKAALEGRAANAGLHLKRCAVCRAQSKASGTSSRPRVAGEPPPRALKNIAPEILDETVETTIATLKGEVEGLYAQNKELRQRLAKYELAPAMEAISKMPWEG